MRLINFCPEANALYLVYNYMPQGALSQYIHGTGSTNSLQAPLKWQERVKISLDVARGIEYLHVVCKPSIIHGAINSNNILLDENISANVSEFGIIEIMSHTQNTISLSMEGSKGYDDPERRIDEIPTLEGDIYSFGVLLLEMISGNKPLFGVSRIPPYLKNIRDWVKNHTQVGDLEEIIDPSIRNSCTNIVSMEKFVSIALMCVQEHRINRPSITEVILSLEEVLHEIEREDCNLNTSFKM
ncbi:hypothetical protein SUGI_0194780 [Cryptomeria japonica]|nr:hypothetical protein SUGI_0194780 [Cryptomeria japonica]